MDAGVSTTFGINVATATDPLSISRYDGNSCAAEARRGAGWQPLER